jgi:hypothetical protein
VGKLVYTFAIILIIVWAIGFLGGFITSGIIHFLLVIAAIAVLISIIQGKKPL